MKAITDLSSHLTTWSRNDDKRLYRMVYYLDNTTDHLLVGAVQDPPEELSLSLLVDADFAGSDDNAKSTNGGLLVLTGPRTHFPIQWVSKRQSCAGRSTTESEVISLAHSLSSEAMPAGTKS